VLYPFVKLSEYLTRSMTHGPGLKGFNRDEFTAMAELSWQNGLLARLESKILVNLLTLHEVKVKDVMTPQSVMFAIPELMTTGEYCQQHESERFSRIPVYGDGPEKITGFVLLNDLLLAQARGESDQQVVHYIRELPAVTGAIALSKAFDQLLQQRAIIFLVVDEYGGVKGLLTLEDVLETILGLEIIDEGDKSKDMQELARHFWRRRARKKGLKLDPERQIHTDLNHSDKLSS